MPPPAAETHPDRRPTRAHALHAAAAAGLLALGALASGALAVRPVLLLATLAAGLVWAWADARWPPATLPVGPRVGRGLALLVAGVAVVINLPTLSADFLGDDFGYVRLFHDKPLASFVRLGDISEGIWGQPLDELRPLFALSFKLGLLLHGPQPAGFHATNLLLHALCCLLLIDLLVVVTAGRWATAVAAGLLFAVMPAHSEAVAWVTGKVDLLPTVFYLATLGAFARWRAGRGRHFGWLAFALFLPGLLTKEILITLPAVLVAFDLLVTPTLEHQRARGRTHPARLLIACLPFVLAAGAFLALRAAVFDNAARAGRLTWPRLKLFLAAQPDKAASLLAPFDPTTTPGALLAVTALGLLGGASVMALRGRDARLLAGLTFFAVAWYGLTLLPLLVTYSSARHLYLPSCGLAAAVALLLLPRAGPGAARGGLLRLASLGLLVTAQGVQLVQANAEWSAAGSVSQRLRTQLAAAIASAPPTTTLLLSGLPITEGDVVVWKFALPFALQPPFVARDLYAGRRVLVPHGASSQPLAAWWRDTQAVLTPWLHGADAERLDMLLLHWNARRGELSVHPARPTRALLRRQALRALEARPEDVPALDPLRADRLMAVLAEAARHSPAFP